MAAECYLRFKSGSELEAGRSQSPPRQFPPIWADIFFRGGGVAACRTLSSQK